MEMALIGGVAVLVVVLAGVVLVMRRRGASREIDLGSGLPAEPQRRRSVGPASMPETQPAPEPDANLPLAPRRRVDIGLTPIETPDVITPEIEEEVHDETPAEPIAEAPIPLVDEAPMPPPAFPERRPAAEAAPAEPDAAAPAADDEPPSILAQLKTKKKSAPGALAGAAEGAVVAAPVGPSEVEETVSLVLVRQVPPRFDEAPRSWIGGLPMMPDGIEWPRSVAPERLEEGEVPLHFVAQIACADFPEDLWGGVGPRSGWLLLFLNPHDVQGDDPRLFRVLHTQELGNERQPPADIRPVESDEVGQSDYRWCASADAIPTTWRRWPVDLVAVPNEAHDDGYRMAVTPKNFAISLHGGAPVASGRPNVEEAAPFSWRGALYVVDSALRALREAPVAGGVARAQQAVLENPGYIASLVPELRAREEQWLSSGEGAILFKEEPLRERERELRDRIAPIAEERRQRIDRLAAFIIENPNGPAVARRIEQDARSEAEWRAAAVERLAAIRAQIADRPLDTPLAAADWAALRDALDQDRHARWTVEWTSRNSDVPVMIVEQHTSLLDLASAGIEAAVVELAADYQGDPELEGLIPDTVRAALEPHWRALTDNRPHRIGGFHDGLQSEPEDGPQTEVLLFQIASDEAMHWNWGDGGAYFLFISPRDLAAGRFENAEIRLEQP